VTRSQAGTSNDAPETVQAAPPVRRNRLRAIVDIPEFGVVAACVLVFVVVTILQPRFANASNLQLNGDGSVRNLGGFTTITSTSGIGREGVDERLFRFGLRFAF